MIGSEATWHAVECGSYAADLELWSSLGREAGGPVLELGCGSGRVALRLAAEGHQVTAIDSSPELIAELRLRAAADRIEIDAIVADARELALARRFAGVLAPMQLAHLLGGPAGRAAMLAGAAAHLYPGGFLAAALLAEPPERSPEAAAALPDVLERDGYVYASLPVDFRALAGGFELRRLRQLVSPGGELREQATAIRLDALSPQRFEAEAAAAGFEPRERIEVPATADHMGSVVCVLEAPR